MVIYDSSVPYDSAALYDGGASVLPSLPTLSVQVGFTNNWADETIVWTDITAFVRAFRTTMGRQHQLDRVEASTAQITLDNRGGQFSPWNTSSPYYSSTPGQGLVPRKPVRIQATWSGTTYNVFYGFVDNWTVTPTDVLNQDCTLQATDALKLLGLKYLVNSTLYPNTVLALNPVAYYRLNETSGNHAASATEATGPAALSGTVQYDVAGAMVYDPSSAWNFGNGTTGTGWLTSISPPNPDTSAWTFEAWIMTTAHTQQIFTWYATGGGSFDPSAVCLIVDVNGRLALADGIAQPPPWTSATPFLAQVTGGYVNDGQWHHVVVTAGPPAGSTSTWTLYLDSVAQGAWAGEYWGETHNAPLTIGGIVYNGPSFPAGSAATFDGVIDEIAIYQSVLSSTAITNNFTVGRLLRNSNLTSDKITEALDVAGWPSWTYTGLQAGSQPCQPEAQSTTLTTALDFIMYANDTEVGLFYQKSDGTFSFSNRFYCYTNATSTTSQGTFGDNTGTSLHFQIQALNIPQDDLDLWSDVTAQRTNGILQEATSSTSTTAYGWSTLQRTSLMCQTDAQALNTAELLLCLYGSPLLRVDSITLASTANSGANLPQMLGRNLLDRVTIQRQGPGETQFAQDSVIEHIAHSFDSATGVWRTTWKLSPQEIAKNAFIFGKSGSDTLNGPAVLFG